MLDSAFASPSVFKKLKTKANLAHVRVTYRKVSTTEDLEIYALANKEDRFVVTIDGDFAKLVKPRQAGVLRIPPYLSNQQIDDLLTAFIKGKNPDDFKGKVTKVAIKVG